MKKRVLAFDFGASSGRAIVGEYCNGTLNYNEIHRFDNNAIMHGGKLCWNFYSLLEQVYIAIDKAGNVDSIAFDTWGVDYGLLDTDGKLISLPVCYRDKRTEGILEKVSKVMPLKELYAKTGTQIMEINTLMQLLTEDLTKVETLLFMPDLFAYMLCGNKVCEKTIFSTSQMADLNLHGLSNEILEKFALKKELFAPIVKSGSVIGEYKGAKVIAVAGHDTQSAVVALPTNSIDVAFLSCGTWSLLGAEVEKPILTEISYKMAFSNELGANGKINYLTNITGLWLIQECRRYWKKSGQAYSYTELEKLANECTIDVPTINVDDQRFATPNDMPKKIIDYCTEHGLYKPQTIGEICLCIYKSLAHKYASALSELEKITGKNFTALHILGGGSQAKLLCSLTAKYCNIPTFAGPVEATALGNIVVQLQALGAVKNLEEGRQLIANSNLVESIK